MKIIKNFLLCILFLLAFVACKEDKRFEIVGDDSVAPSPPEYITFKPLVGGARVFYSLPPDKDIISINAEYVNNSGKKSVFAASYFTDSLDIYGFADTLERTVQLYAIDRAGNRSPSISITVKAAESALQQITKSVKVTPAFNSFLVVWENELQQTVNIYVDMVFDKAGVKRDVTWVLSSKEAAVEEIIDNVRLADDESLTVNIRAGDAYGNITDGIEVGEIQVMNDHLLEKDGWRLPNANDMIGGVPMCFGDAFEAKSLNVINGIVSIGETMDIMHTGGRGRTGKIADGNSPWNFIIDLGDYYELSRIVTNQRHDLNAVPYDPNVKGYYYQGVNVNRYNMYFLDEETGAWEFISQHTIPVPSGISELEIAKMGAAGDMALMYPEAPAFTKPARWFRYEAISGFGGTPEVLSEITLYGKKTSTP
ncbi:MAG TPA: DUF4959 domain-containing protein [Parapedobacter sp.]|uniref:DUF4959 domain-containing protein n=1 Tax=Parapedobacter sp. TaxID=1958893 RepID=UPI002CAA3058|nr:DUF4959 domain-containing protein [Parapedobacter sp.]HWK59037.1 DUF4959 domain-containing protein [Parapedobacter sp.]